MNEFGGFIGLVMILGIAVALIYINVLILRWMFKIDRIVWRLDQIAEGMAKLNTTMSEAHPAAPPAGTGSVPPSSSPPSSFEEQQAAYQAKQSKGSGDVPNIPMR